MPQNGSGSHIKSAIAHICALILGFIFLVLASFANDKGAYYETVKHTKSLDPDFGPNFVPSYGPYSRKFCNPKFGVCPHGGLLLGSVIIFCVSWVASILALLTMNFSKSNRQTPHENACLLHVFALFKLFAVGLLGALLVSISNSQFPHCKFSDKGEYSHTRHLYFGRSSTYENTITGNQGRAAPEPTEDDFKSCQDVTDYIYKYKVLIAAMVFAIAAIVLHFAAGILFGREASSTVTTMGMTGNVVGGPVQGNWQQQQQFGNGGGQTITPGQYQFGGGQMITTSQAQVPQAQAQQQLQPTIQS